MKSNAIFLLDLSASMSIEDFQESFQFVELESKRHENCALIGFDYHAHIIIPMGGDILKWPKPEKLPGRGGTCAREALKVAKEMDATAKVFLLGDGMMPEDSFEQMGRQHVYMRVIGSHHSDAGTKWAQEMMQNYRFKLV